MNAPLASAGLIRPRHFGTYERYAYNILDAFEIMKLLEHKYTEKETSIVTTTAK
jgi:hypothetical protein